ncbi:MAG: gliding motility lipoprotein GldD [Bacteroidales bacterium]|nr:gliding motility lipoprotein GldD [Bacteroidales bacterium]
MKKKPRNKNQIAFFAFLWLILLISSCGGNDYSPKPRGYIRIDLPEKNYVKLDTNFPYTFEYPAYTKITRNPSVSGHPYWINIVYPGYKGKVHLSYKQVNGNLGKYIEDSYKMAMQHIPKANAIKETVIRSSERHVYGTTYRIGGTEAASPYQFYVTDSTDHFLRGALYFNVVPNNDSLRPVIDFIIEDINHMLSTLHWKNYK